MDVIAFNLPGNMPVYLISIFLGLGATLGLAWIAWSSPAEGLRSHLDAGLFVLLGGLVGGRLLYVFVYWHYFQAHPYEIPQVFLGGLSWPGIALGGLLALGIYAALTRQSLGALADALIPLAVTLIVAAWMGCWVDGCVYGPQVNAWWALPGRDEWGVLAPRLPLQILAALLTLALFWLIDKIQGRFIFPGAFAASGVFLFSLLFFGLSFLRVDPAPHWFGLYLDAWAALVIGVLACGIFLAGIIITYRRNNGIWKKTGKSEVP